MNVAQVDARRGADFPYTAAELAQIMQAVRNEGYPPQGRTGIGTVLRKQTA